MVLMKRLMEMTPPKMGEWLVMMMTMVSPSGREVPPVESARQRAKVLLPKFRLETVALHPESPLLIISRSEASIYQKGGTGGWLGWPPPTRPRQGGLARPDGWWAAQPTSGAPLLVYLCHCPGKN
jgi:hypothetical protein